MRIVIWILQIAIAGMFIMSGFMKVSTPIEVMAEKMPWVKEMAGLVRFIGITEILGGLGLVLPSLLKIKPFLTTWAGIGLALIMVFAMVFHIARSEYASLPINIILGGIALYVAWARVKTHPIQ